MNYRVWYSTESFADYIIANTNLCRKNVTKKKMYESDASKPREFHTLPDHIKKILYLDAPDIIVELDSEPIFSMEVSTEAGTGHNVFQRFARLAASIENGVPAFYIYPEAVAITRHNALPKWDKINPLIFKALEDAMNIYKIPALFYYFPSDYKTYPNPSIAPHLNSKGLKFDVNRNYAGSPDHGDPEMQSMFQAVNEIISVMEMYGAIRGRGRLLSKRTISTRKSFMQREYVTKGGNEDASPLSATVIIPTAYLLNYLSRYESGEYHIGELLRSREETVIYKVDAVFRGDPYPGALAAIDYLLCREGRTFEERKYNLVMCWGNFEVNDREGNFTLTGANRTVHDFVNAVKASEAKNLLTKNYMDMSNYEIPRYYMQVRYGSTYSKVKHIRVYSYFADAIIFPDEALWRDA